MAPTHALDRWLYRGGRPNRVARTVNSAWVQVTGRGHGPAAMSVLEVRGRRSGRPIRLPIVVIELGGQRYLVGMLGERTNWVRNVRAAGGRAALVHGRRETVHLEEVEPGRRAEILRSYLARAPGARAHIDVPVDAPLAEFERVAAAHPVFRVASTATIEP